MVVLLASFPCIEKLCFIMNLTTVEKNRERQNCDRSCDPLTDEPLEGCGGGWERLDCSGRDECPNATYRPTLQGIQPAVHRFDRRSLHRSSHNPEFCNERDIHRYRVSCHCQGVLQSTGITAAEIEIPGSK